MTLAEMSRGALSLVPWGAALLPLDRSESPDSTRPSLTPPQHVRGRVPLHCQIGCKRRLHVCFPLMPSVVEKGGFLLPAGLKVLAPSLIFSDTIDARSGVRGGGGPSLQSGESRSLNSLLDIYFQRHGWDDNFEEGSVWLMYFIKVLQRN